MKKESPNNQTYQYYLYECIEQLKEAYAKTLQNLLDSKDNKEDQLFYSGMRLGQYYALETLRVQAQGFLIPLKDIGLEDEIPV